jgi:hypothetical protein
MDQKPLDLYPFLLFFSEIVCTLSLLNFFIEFVDNNGDEQVHDEESGQENKDHVDKCNRWVVLNYLHLIIANLIHSLEHHLWPHFKC